MKNLKKLSTSNKTVKFLSIILIIIGALIGGAFTIMGIYITQFFKEIGWVEELGSGVRNIYKYNKIYAGVEPTFVEGDVFKTFIPLVPQATPQAIPQAELNGEEDRTSEILEFCKTARSRNKIQDYIGLKDRKGFRTSILNPLIKGGLLKLTIPDKPTSP